MHIAVIGASGRTGSLVVQAAIARGHSVTAVVRSPDKLGDIAPNVTVVQASATDTERIADGVRGAHVVISALGHNASSGEHVLAEGVACTLAAMKLTGVRRIAMISAAGHETDGDGWFTKHLVKPVLGLFLRTAFADTKVAEGLLMASDVDWLIVRAPMLLNGSARGYVSRERLNVRGHFTMTRADLADALLDLSLAGSFRTVFAVASGKPRQATRPSAVTV